MEAKPAQNSQFEISGKMMTYEEALEFGKNIKDVAELCEIVFDLNAIGSKYPKRVPLIDLTDCGFIPCLGFLTNNHNVPSLGSPIFDPCEFSERENSAKIEDLKEYPFFFEKCDIFEHIKENPHLAVAGGCILKKFRTFASKGDIDIFMIEKNVREEVIDIYKNLPNPKKSEKKIITFKQLTTEYKSYQLIHRIYQKGIHEILNSFDISSCKFGFYQGRYYCSLDALMCLFFEFNVADPYRKSPSFWFRLVKYQKRGFIVLLPGLKHSRGGCETVVFDKYNKLYVYEQHADIISTSPRNSFYDYSNNEVKQKANKEGFKPFRYFRQFQNLGRSVKESKWAFCELSMICKENGALSPFWVSFEKLVLMFKDSICQKVIWDLDTELSDKNDFRFHHKDGKMQIGKMSDEDIIKYLEVRKNFAKLCREIYGCNYEKLEAYLKGKDFVKIIEQDPGKQITSSLNPSPVRKPSEIYGENATTLFDRRRFWEIEKVPMVIFCLKQRGIRIPRVLWENLIIPKIHSKIEIPDVKEQKEDHFRQFPLYMRFDN